MQEEKNLTDFKDELRNRVAREKDNATEERNKENEKEILKQEQVTLEQENLERK